MRQGFAAGDRLALLLPNEGEYYLIYACEWLGVTAVPLNTRLSAVEIDHVLAMRLRVVYSALIIVGSHAAASLERVSTWNRWKFGGGVPPPLLFTIRSCPRTDLYEWHDRSSERRCAHTCGIAR